MSGLVGWLGLIGRASWAGWVALVGGLVGVLVGWLVDELIGCFVVWVGLDGLVTDSMFGWRVWLGWAGWLVWFGSLVGGWLAGCLAGLVG